MATYALGTLHCCLGPGFLFFWKELNGDGGSCTGGGLKFLRQYPDFGCVCLSKIYVQWFGRVRWPFGGLLAK